MSNQQFNDGQGMTPASDAQRDDQSRWRAFLNVLEQGALRQRTTSADELGNHIAAIQGLEAVVYSGTISVGRTQAVTFRAVLNRMVELVETLIYDAKEAYFEGLMQQLNEKAVGVTKEREAQRERAIKEVEALLGDMKNKFNISEERPDPAEGSASGSKKRAGKEPMGLEAMFQSRPDISDDQAGQAESSGSRSKKTAETVDDGVELESLRMETLEKELQAANDRNIDLENRLSDAESDVEEFARQLQLSRDEINDARSQIELRDQKISSLEDQLGEAESARSLSALSVQAPVGDNEALVQARETIGQLEEGKSRLMQEAMEEIAARDQEIQRLKANENSDGTVEQINAQQVTIADLDADCQAKSAAIVRKDAEIRDMAATISLRDATIGDRDAALEQLKATVAEKNATIEQQRAFTRQVEVDTAQGEAATKEMQSTIASLQSEKLTMQQSADQQTQQLEAFKANNGALKRMAEAASAENARLQGENAGLQQKLAGVNSWQLSAEARMAKRLVDVGETDLDLQKALLNTQEELGQTQAELNRALSSSRELKRARSRVRSLEEAHKTDGSNIKALREENRRLETRAEADYDLRRKYSSSQQELSSAKDKLEILRQQVASLEASPIRHAVHDMAAKVRRDREELERLKAKVKEQDSKAAQDKKEMQRLADKCQSKSLRDGRRVEKEESSDAHLVEEASVLQNELTAAKKKAAADQRTMAFQRSLIRQLQEDAKSLSEGKKGVVSRREPLSLAMLQSIRATFADIKPRPAWPARTTWAA